MSEGAKLGSKDSVAETRLESRVQSTPVPAVQPVNGRYTIGKLLGQGGMAAVFEATDTVNGKRVALKQFTLPRDDRHYAESASLFEHEFLTLAELSHPRIIEVYDYSVSELGPYYTMELIDGGDLRERSPMPWRDACGVIYDVCSSLALLHSRRLIHRDISPRNIRCSSDGQAKLIDFGALVPMGPGDLIVGTPQFVAPEVVYRGMLDARTDLYSLGATLYYTLTGRVPYAAKTFEQVLSAWELKPAPPSALVSGIPPLLDALVLSLVSTTASSRPRSAFEVMQRLAAIAGLERAEPATVSRAYLSTPSMVGRDSVMSTVNHEMSRAFGGRGRAVLIQGAAGLGRSRVLDAAALAAKALGAAVLRAYGGAQANAPFKVARSIAEQLVAALPDVALAAARSQAVVEALFETTSVPGESGIRLERPALKQFDVTGTARVELQSALSKWLLAVSNRVSIAIAIDDLHRIDEPSLALLAGIASQVKRERCIVLATAELDANPTDRAAFAVFARNSTRLSLGPLERQHVEQLLVSVFGDVPNAQLLTDRIHAVALGNPRAAMDLAQHLVDKGLLRYEGGGWTLPARVDAANLPATAEDVLTARMNALPPLARALLQAQALASHFAFTREEFGRLSPRATVAEVDSAVRSLISSQFVVSDGRVYTIPNEGLRAFVAGRLEPAEAIEQHRALVGLYEGRNGFGVVRHALNGGLPERALEEIKPLLREWPERSPLMDSPDVGIPVLASTFEQALTEAERLNRSPREISDIRQWLAALSVVAEHKYFIRAAPAWLTRLKHDSGYDEWVARADIAEPGERLSTAMQVAYGRYMSTPEADRVYRPDEAISGLVRYVAMSIAVGSARLDTRLTEGLPELLEPFAPINELVDIVWQNAIATREVTCRLRPERGRTMWIRDYERLGNVTGANAEYTRLIRNAIAFGLGTCEAWMGMESSVEWASRLDDDSLQQVSALQLRRTARMQLGDWEGAERYRKEAEILGLQARSRQMFTNVTQVEINASALAGDLTGLKQCIDRVKVLAADAPTWIPTLRLAEARFGLLCGNFEEALALVDEALAILESPEGPVYPLNNAWCGAVATRVDALRGLGRYAEAKQAAERALSFCERNEIGVPAHDISRALALAEAHLGDHAAADARLAKVIEQQRELGISGLRLGASYEARARVALAAKDSAAADEYMHHTAREYRYGQGSALGARYERLLQDAERAAGIRLPTLADFESSNGSASSSTSATVVVTEAMKGAGGTKERAERALYLLCDVRAAATGHLYLFDDGKVRLAASRGADAPSTGMEGFIGRVLARELAECDAVTRIAKDLPPEPLDVDTHITDVRGTHYYPLLLRGVIDGVPRYAGVALIGFQERPTPPDEGLVAAVSIHFIQSGDTAGMEYGGWQTEGSDP